MKQDELETGVFSYGLLGKAGFAYKNNFKAWSKVIGRDDFEGASEKLNVILFQ